MASAALAAELSMHKPSSIIAITLSPSTTTFDSVVWDRCSTMLKFVGLYSFPMMTMHFLLRYSFAVFSSCTVLIVNPSSSSHVLPIEGFASFWVLPRVPSFLVERCPSEGAMGCMSKGFYEQSVSKCEFFLDFFRPVRDRGKICG